MKTTDKATVHILVKATTNSEWDNCGFAIIHLSEAWKKEQAERLEMVKSAEGNYHFCSMRFYDTAVDFYNSGREDNHSIETMLAGKQWVFVELDQKERKTFTVPENSLQCYKLVLMPNGTAFYTAYGKHTCEEFWTEEFDLNILCNAITAETEIESSCKKRFEHLSNTQLVARVNGLPDFGWDDEGVELQRRRRFSNGAFDYEFKGDTMVILKNEQP